MSTKALLTGILTLAVLGGLGWTLARMNMAPRADELTFLTPSGPTTSPVAMSTFQVSSPSPTSSSSQTPVGSSSPSASPTATTSPIVSPSATPSVSSGGTPTVSATLRASANPTASSSTVTSSPTPASSAGATPIVSTSQAQTLVATVFQTTTSFDYIVPVNLDSYSVFDVLKAAPQFGNRVALSVVKLDEAIAALEALNH